MSEVERWNQQIRERYGRAMERHETAMALLAAVEAGCIPFRGTSWGAPGWFCGAWVEGITDDTWYVHPLSGESFRHYATLPDALKAWREAHERTRD
jgi:hypothetical protein